MGNTQAEVFVYVELGASIFAVISEVVLYVLGLIYWSKDETAEKVTAARVLVWDRWVVSSVLGAEFFTWGLLAAVMHRNEMVTGGRPGVDDPACWTSVDTSIGGIGVRAVTLVNGCWLITVFILGLMFPAKHNLSYTGVVFGVGLYAALFFASAMNQWHYEILSLDDCVALCALFFVHLQMVQLGVAAKEIYISRHRVIALAVMGSSHLLGMALMFVALGEVVRQPACDTPTVTHVFLVRLDPTNAFATAAFWLFWLHLVLGWSRKSILSASLHSWYIKHDRTANQTVHAGWENAWGVSAGVLMYFMTSQQSSARSGKRSIEWTRDVGQICALGATVVGLGTICWSFFKSFKDRDGETGVERMLRSIRLPPRDITQQLLGDTDGGTARAV